MLLPLNYRRGLAAADLNDNVADSHLPWPRALSLFVSMTDLGSGPYYKMDLITK
jgi:hypothetical protein